MGCLFAPKRVFLCHSRGVLRFAGSAVKCFKPSLGRRAQIGFGFLAVRCNPRRVLGNVLGASDRTKPTGVCRDEVVPQISPRASLSQIRAGVETIPRFQVSSFDANVASKGTLTNPAPRRQRRGGKRVSGIKTLGLAFISFAFLMVSWQPRSSMRNPAERCLTQLSPRSQQDGLCLGSTLSFSSALRHGGQIPNLSGFCP